MDPRGVLLLALGALLLCASLAPWDAKYLLEVQANFSQPGVICVPLPPDIPGWQEVSGISARVGDETATWRIVKDRDGNPWVYVEVKRPGVVTVTISVKVSGRRRAYKIPASDQHGLGPVEGWSWLRGEGSGELRGLVLALWRKSDSVADFVRMAASWVARNVSYTETTAVQLPPETLRTRTGDCADKSVLLAAMLRMVGVRSLIALSLVWDRSAHGGAYVNARRHAFVLVELNDTWIPVDTVCYEGDPAGGALVLRDNKIIVLAFVDEMCLEDYDVSIHPPGAAVIEHVRLERRAPPREALVSVAAAMLWVGAYILPSRAKRRSDEAPAKRAPFSLDDL